MSDVGRDGGGAIAGVVMAAGSSTRMGENKLLLTAGGETFVRRAARAAIAAGLAPVVVVVGHQADEVRRALDGLDCRFVVNPAFADGKGTSLQAGITEIATATEASAAVVLLADMPFVTAEMVAAVAARGRETGAPMVASRYGDVNAPPILYRRPLFAELLGLPAHACGKEMVRRHRHDAEVLDWPEDALCDVDVPADLDRVRARLGETATGGETG